MKTRPSLRNGIAHRGDVVSVLRNLGLGWFKARWVAGGFLNNIDRIHLSVGTGMESLYVSQAWDRLVADLGLEGA